jgi:hypothetical protein
VTPTTPLSALPLPSVNAPLKLTSGGTTAVLFVLAAAGCWAAAIATKHTHRMQARMLMRFIN